MIQAGDPQSKTATDTTTLGNGDVGYTLPAEFNPNSSTRKVHWLLPAWVTK